MKAWIQRVREASVAIDGETVAEIGQGCLVLLGVTHADNEAAADRIAERIPVMRIFEDEAGKANLSVADVGGDVMVISQFTLYANCKKGNRPSFTDAMEPGEAERLYEYFADLARADIPHVATGSFGAMMDVSLVNDGPFTIVLDTDQL